MSITVERDDAVCSNCKERKENVVCLCDAFGPRIVLCVDCIAKLIWPILEEENEEYV